MAERVLVQVIKLQALFSAPSGCPQVAKQRLTIEILHDVIYQNIPKLINCGSTVYIGHAGYMWAQYIGSLMRIYIYICTYIHTYIYIYVHIWGTDYYGLRGVYY